jgi:hypothetical protein
VAALMPGDDATPLPNAHEGDGLYDRTLEQDGVGNEGSRLLWTLPLAFHVLKGLQSPEARLAVCTPARGATVMALLPLPLAPGGVFPRAEALCENSMYELGLAGLDDVAALMDIRTAHLVPSDRVVAVASAKTFSAIPHGMRRRTRA